MVRVTKRHEPATTSETAHRGPGEQKPHIHMYVCAAGHIGAAALPWWVVRVSSLARAAS